MLQPQFSKTHAASAGRLEALASLSRGEPVPVKTRWFAAETAPMGRASRMGPRPPSREVNTVPNSCKLELRYGNHKVISALGFREV